MTKTITQDNLVLYIYHETSTHEALLIEEALQSDWELKELHYSLLEGKVELDGIITSPRPKVIDDILRYSCARSMIKGWKKAVCNGNC